MKKKTKKKAPQGEVIYPLEFFTEYVVSKDPTLDAMPPLTPAKLRRRLRLYKLAGLWWFDADDPLTVSTLTLKLNMKYPQAGQQLDLQHMIDLDETALIKLCMEMIEPDTSDWRTVTVPLNNILGRKKL